MPRPRRRLVGAREPLAARVEREEPIGLLAHAGGEPLEAHREPEAAVALLQRGHGCGLEPRIERGAGERPNLRGRQPTERDGGGRLRQRVEPEDDLGDEAEGAERPAQEARQVEARHVLHHLTAPARDDAVRAHEGDPDDEVAHCAVPCAARPERVRREHAADGRALRVWRIEREPLPVGREVALERGDGHPRLDRDDLIGRGVLADAIEPAGVQHGVEAPGRRAELEIGAAADEHDRGAVAGERAHRLGRLVERARLDGHARAHAQHGVSVRRRAHRAHHRSASPATSAGWGR